MRERSAEPDRTTKKMPGAGTTAAGEASQNPVSARALSPKSQSVRRALAAAALAGSGALLAQLSIRWSDLPTSVAVIGFFGTAALAVTRRSVLGQVAGRGLAIIPATALVYDLLAFRHFDLMLGAIGGGAIAALALTRPLLHTPEAQAAFAPVRFRRLFLTAATIAFTAGTLFSFASFESAAHGHVAGAIGTAALGCLLIASSVGVLKMRGWGALLALLSTLVAFGSIAFGVPAAIALLAAMPGALVGGALATARLAPEIAPLPSAAAGSTRVSSASDEAPAARLRVADHEAEALEAELDLEPPLARAKTR